MQKAGFLMRLIYASLVTEKNQRKPLGYVQGLQRRRCLVLIFSRFFFVGGGGSVFAVCNLVHDVETIPDSFFKTANSIWKYFQKSE